MHPPSRESLKDLMHERKMATAERGINWIWEDRSVSWRLRLLNLLKSQNRADPIRSLDRVFQEALVSLRSTVNFVGVMAN